MHQIRVWVYEGVLASGVFGPIDVFTAANRLWLRQRGSHRRAQPVFEWRVESLDGKPVRTASGQVLAVDGRVNATSPAHAVILLAPFVRDMDRFFQDKRERLQPLFAALRGQHERGAFVATFCNGSYLLAEAGLLDGRVATTHWGSARDFAKRYPRVKLRADEIVTEQERIVCSGAVTAYFNLALRLVGNLAGEDLAAATARLLLIDQNRGSQAAYAMFGVEDELHHADRLVAKAQRWMRTNLAQGFRVADLARQLGTSERTLNRRFKLAIGESPLRCVQSMRIEAAKALLQTRRLPVYAVTEQVGYGDVGAFRELFKRETGLSPRDYRRRFARRDIRG